MRLAQLCLDLGRAAETHSGRATAPVLQMRSAAGILPSLTLHSFLCPFHQLVFAGLTVPGCSQPCICAACIAGLCWLGRGWSSITERCTMHRCCHRLGRAPAPRFPAACFSAPICELVSHVEGSVARSQPSPQASSQPGPYWCPDAQQQQPHAQGVCRLAGQASPAALLVLLPSSRASTSGKVSSAWLPVRFTPAWRADLRRSMRCCRSCQFSLCSTMPQRCGSQGQNGACLAAWPEMSCSLPARCMQQQLGL